MLHAPGQPKKMPTPKGEQQAPNGPQLLLEPTLFPLALISSRLMGTLHTTLADVSQGGSLLACQPAPVVPGDTQV